MKVVYFSILIFLLLGVSSCNLSSTQEENKQMKAVIIDGANNHYVWPQTSLMMKSYLEETGLFTVDIERFDSLFIGFKYNESRPQAHDYFINEFTIDGKERPVFKEPMPTTNFTTDLSNVDVVLLNIGENTPAFSDEMQNNLESYVNNGGGLIVVHAANNAWGDWDEYNKMIGVGAWGGRDGSSGPFVYYNDDGELVKQTEGDICGQHGQEYEFVIKSREPDHPIMKGLPEEWLHTKDEMYDFMRGPFENATILATTFADVEGNRQTWDDFPPGSGKHVPMMIVTNYGQGRVYHTPMGHFDYSQECIGFMTTLQRGAEWAATGEVTQAIPDDFPTKEKSSSRVWVEKE